MKKIFLLMLCLFIVACNEVSQSNFDKIKDNMAMQDVIAILGEPTSSDSISIAGLTGTSAVWKNKHAEITIQFLNGTVYFKSFSKNQAEQLRANKY